MVTTTAGTAPEAMRYSAARRLRSHSREATALGRNCHSLASSVTGSCPVRLCKSPGQLAGLPLIGAEEHCGPPGPGGHRSADAGPLHRRRAGEHGGTAAVFHPCDDSDASGRV